MPITNDHGYSAPADDDPAYTWPATARDLADQVKDQIGIVKRGSALVDIISANTLATLAVTFAVPFPVGVTPIVVASVSGTSAPHARFVATTSASNTGFTINAINTASTNDISVSWIAVG